MDKKTAHAVIQRANDAPGFAIFSRAVWARKTKSDAVHGKMLMDNSVIKLPAVVSLKGDERQLKLR